MANKTLKICPILLKEAELEYLKREAFARELSMADYVRPKVIPRNWFERLPILIDVQGPLPRRKGRPQKKLKE